MIISEEPYVCVANNSTKEFRCDGCFKTSNLKKCSACQVVWYCGSTCQVRPWDSYTSHFVLIKSSFGCASICLKGSSLVKNRF